MRQYESVPKHETGFEKHELPGLVKIRCPFQVSKHDRQYACNRLCVRVGAGSSGEAWCNSCRKTFPFEVTGS